MNFTKRLKQRIQPEWGKLYLDYGQIKEMLMPYKLFVKKQKNDEIKELSLQKLNGESIEQEILPSPLKDDMEQQLQYIFVILKEQLEYSKQFFDLKLKVIKIQSTRIQKNVENALQAKLNINNYQKKQQKQLTKQLNQLKRTLELLYIQIYYLQQFNNVNNDIMIQIERKLFINCFYIKSLDNQIQNIQQCVQQLNQENDIKQLSILQQSIELSYAHLYSNQHAYKQIKKLKLFIQSKQHQNIYYFKAGYFLGMSTCVLIAIIVYAFTLQQYPYDTEYDVFFPLYRCFGLFIIYHWQLAICVYLWEYFQINYQNILELTKVSTSTQIFKRASIITSLYLIIFLLAMIRQNIEQNDLPYHDFISSIIPFDVYQGILILYAVFFVYLFLPLKKYWNYQGRIWFIKQVGYMLISPFLQINFLIQLFTGQLLSLTTPLKDFVYTVCFYESYIGFSIVKKNCAAETQLMSGLIVAGFPATLRVIQCLVKCHQMGQWLNNDSFKNAIKFSISFITVCFSYFYSKNKSNELFVCWVVFASISMLYNFYWDTVKSWTLMDKNSIHPYLRDNLLFPPYVYYIAICLNFVLRCSWILSLSPHFYLIFRVQWQPGFTMILSTVEIMRRGLWNFLRIERDHANNIQKFKAAPPLIFPFDKPFLPQVTLENFDDQKGSIAPKGTRNNSFSESQEVLNKLEELEIKIEEIERKRCMSMDQPEHVRESILIEEFGQTLNAKLLQGLTLQLESLQRCQRMKQMINELYK